MKTFNVNLAELKQKVETIGRNNSGSETHIISIPLNQRAETAIREMASETEFFKSSKLETKHMLLAILKNEEDMLHKF